MTRLLRHLGRRIALWASNRAINAAIREQHRARVENEREGRA